MWLMTPEGMFSAVVHDADPNALQIRTRSKQDALNLATWLVANDVVQLDEVYPTAESLVLEWKGRDYPCRLLLWREQWAAYAAWSVEQITYRNFKNEVKKRQGDRRASIYGRVWSALLEISREHLPQPKPSKSTYWSNTSSSYALWDDLHNEYPSLADELASAAMGRPSVLTSADTDDRCPRCDKFLSDVGTNRDGDCKVCAQALEDAIEREDWDAVKEISIDLGLLAE